MKKGYKKLISIIIITMLIGLFPVISTSASATLSVSKTTVNVGETVTVTATTTAGAWNLSMSGSEISTTGFVGQTDTTDNVTRSKTVTFKADKVGTYTISLTGDITDFNTDANSKISQTKTITVKEKGSTSDNKSSNNYLKGLKVDQGTLSPKFEKDRTSYTINIGKDINEVKVTATVDDSKAKTTIKGNTNLQPGTNRITIEVKAETGKTRTYVINAVKEGEVTNPNNAENGLSELSLKALLEDGTSSDINFSPEFAINTYEYACTVPENTKSLDITAYALDQNAIVDIKGAEELADGENVVTITVTKEDGTVATYTIKVTRQAKEVAPITDQGLLNNLERNKMYLIIGVAVAILVICFILILIIIRKRKKARNRSYDDYEEIEQNSIGNISFEEADKTQEKRKRGKHF